MRHVGIDVGGTSVRALAETGRERGRVVRHAVPGDYEDLLALLARLGRDADAVMIGLPGTSTAGVPRFVPALPWLAGRPLADDLSELLDAPVRLGLDGHLTLLAEATEGAAKGRRSAVLVAVGTGIGGALLVEGRVWRGAHGSAGSWGWLPMPDHPDFESAASGSALGGRGPGLVAHARAGESAAVEELRGYAVRLSRGLAALASVIDPEIVLIGGGMADAMDVLGPLLDTARFASPDGGLVPVAATGLGSDAGVVGALLAARIGAEW
ncbi:ROK family protein [Microtetraspora malaysiensis]|uniref:ROK family protein n=1 Tax=Microtetraspora malaysiensis TaxID=161358 RepID=A0ABW6T5G1_9ACTN